MEEIQLSDLLASTGADGAIIVSMKGELLDSENIDSKANIAAMLGVMASMCEGFTDDIGVGKFRQIVLKADDGVFIADELYDENVIVGLYSKNISKAGMMKIYLDKINKK